MIPARLAATRLPDKPLRLLGGRPLVVRVWERVQAMELADRCVVATDDAKVARTVTDAGGECVLTAASCQSGTERVGEVARRKEFRDYEMFVNVQGDEPFIANGSVRSAISCVSDGGYPLGTAAVHARREILDQPNVVKVVVDNAGRALYFSRAPIPYIRDRSDIARLDARVLQHVGVYAYTRAALQRWIELPENDLERIERLEQLRPLAAGLPMAVGVTDDVAATGIDTEEDLARANERWSEAPASAA